MKKLMSILAGTALALSAIGVHAQTWPTRPVKIIVPFSAGGLADILARQLGEELGKVWKQPVVVENRAGASTMIAGEATAKAAPDGYTLLLANDATISSNQYIYKKMPYDPLKDFVHIGRIISVPFLLLLPLVPSPLSLPLLLLGLPLLPLLLGLPCVIGGPLSR